jgi:hypothetical protein
MMLNFPSGTVGALVASGMYAICEVAMAVASFASLEPRFGCCFVALSVVLKFCTLRSMNMLNVATPAVNPVPVLNAVSVKRRSAAMPDPG